MNAILESIRPISLPSWNLLCGQATANEPRKSGQSCAISELMFGFLRNCRLSPQKTGLVESQRRTPNEPPARSR